MTRRRGQPLVAGLHAVDGVAARSSTRAVAPVRTVPPWRSMNARAGSAYIRCSGLVGSAIAAARGSLPNISASTRANSGAAACAGGWLSAASASGSQSISRRRGVWPLRISQFSTVSPGDAAFRVAPGSSSRRAQLAAACACRAPTRGRATTARPSRTRRRGDGTAAAAPGTSSRDAPAGAIDHRHGELRLQPDVVRGADVAQEREASRCSSRAARAGRCRRARRSRDRETRSRGRRGGARLEHEHARAAPGQADRRAQAGEAGADDDDIEVCRGHQVHSHCLSAMSACCGRGTRARAVNTS